MAKFAFLVTVGARPTLCEGGVYTDNAAILARAAEAEEYADHDLAQAEADAAELNVRHEKTAYLVTDSLAGVDCGDGDVFASLADWQIVAVAGALATADTALPVRIAQRLADVAGDAILAKPKETRLFNITGTMESDLATLEDATTEPARNFALAFRAMAEGTVYSPAAVLASAALLAGKVMHWRMEAENLEAQRGAAARETETVRSLNKRLADDNNTYRAQRDEQGKRAREAERAEVAANMRAERLADELDAVRTAALRERAEAEALALALSERMERAEARLEEALPAIGQLERLMKEIGGLTLAQLPGGAYGGSLADLYCDIKAGR